MPRRSSARLRELVAGASAFLAVGFEQPELGQGFEVAAGGVVGAPGEVGVFAGSHVAHETLQEAGERLALARVDLRGGRLAPEPGPPEDAFHHEVRGVGGAPQAPQEPDAPTGGVEGARLGRLEFLVVLGAFLADLGG